MGKVRTMLTELNCRLKEYDVTVPRAGSRKIAVQITESARKASEAEQALLNAEDPDAAASNKYGLKSTDFFSKMQRHTNRNRISHGKGFTTDGRFLYVHCSRGLIKIGTGDQNTRKWEFYGCRSYRN